MKKVIVIILLWMLTNSIYSQWDWLNPYPQGNTLKKVQIMSENTVYAIGENRTFIKSINGGNSWEIIKHFDYPDGDFNAMDFINADKGIIVGGSGLIIKTEDGGNTWSRLNTNYNYDFTGVQFLSDTVIFLNGDELLKSTDGGLNWEGMILGEEIKSLKTFYFINSNIGWVVGPVDSTSWSDVAILKTEDGGNTWVKISMINDNPRNIHFYNRNLGWVTVNNTYYRTQDGGVTWEQIFISQYAHIYSISFVDSTKGWAVGTRGEIYNTTNFGKNWSKYTSSVRNTFYSVQMINDSTGWIVGEDGNIFRTIDGGINWSDLSYKIEGNFRDVEFSSNNEGWLLSYRPYTESGWQYFLYKITEAGDSLQEITNWVKTRIESIEFIDDSLGWVAGTKIFKTTDAGNSWIDQSIDEGLWLYDACFVDNDFGWVVGLGGKIYQTTNGGDEWNQQNINTNLGIIKIQMIDRNLGWCAGEYGMVFQTTNGGLDWIDHSSVNLNSITALNFISDNTGWIASDKIFKTTNSGETWIEQYSAGHQLHFIKFIDQLNGYAAGNYGVILKTTDGGETWSTMISGTRNALWAGDFTDRENGWLVGNDGVFLKLNSNIVSVDEENRDNLLNTFELYQNYPNPFNPSTKIKFSLPNFSHPSPYQGEGTRVSLVVYDILGRQVKTLLNKKLFPGRYEVEFNGINLSSGVYLYRLQIGDTHIVKKMMLIK